MSKAQQFFEDYHGNYPKTQKKFPEALSGFSNLFSKVMKDGALTLKEKELVAIGIAVAIHCEPCIRLHIKKALELGVTEEQIIDAASVGVVMGGGPAATHLPIVTDTLDHLREAK